MIIVYIHPHKLGRDGAEEPLIVFYVYLSYQYRDAIKRLVFGQKPYGFGGI